mmetsp:Transcript_69222/g.122697  ORF Transcript_69222/g.122697 Transcript_69222/m.122697 type:complete len:89 (-) Transcript_69222:94-360(-)
MYVPDDYYSKQQPLTSLKRIGAAFLTLTLVSASHNCACCKQFGLANSHLSNPGTSKIPLGLCLEGHRHPPKPVAAHIPFYYKCHAGAS